jgi:hypothetical protein
LGVRHTHARKLGHGVIYIPAAENCCTQGLTYGGRDAVKPIIQTGGRESRGREDSGIEVIVTFSACSVAASGVVFVIVIAIIVIVQHRSFGGVRWPVEKNRLVILAKRIVLPATSYVAPVAI